MPANTSPIFTLTTRMKSCEITAANTARDGSGALVDLFTAGPNGALIGYVKFNNAQASPAASTAMVWRAFITDAAGLNPRLFAELAAPSVTASNTAVGQSQTMMPFNGLVLEAGQKIQVAQSVYAGVQDKSQVWAQGGDY